MPDSGELYFQVCGSYDGTGSVRLVRQKMRTIVTPFIDEDASHLIIRYHVGKSGVILQFWNGLERGIIHPHSEVRGCRQEKAPLAMAEERAAGRNL